MSDRKTVLEAKVTADMTIHMPIASGGDVKESVIEAIRSADDESFVRWVDEINIHQIYPIEEY